MTHDIPAGPPKLRKVLNSLKDMLHDGEHLAHAKCNILRCAYEFSLIFYFFVTFRKPWNVSFSGHRIFPDLALAQHQDTYHSFGLTISHLNLTVGSRALAISVAQCQKYFVSHSGSIGACCRIVLLSEREVSRLYKPYNITHEAWSSGRAA